MSPPVIPSSPSRHTSTPPPPGPRAIWFLHCLQQPLPSSKKSPLVPFLNPKGASQNLLEVSAARDTRWRPLFPMSFLTPWTRPSADPWSSRLALWLLSSVSKAGPLPWTPGSGPGSGSFFIGPLAGLFPPAHSSQGSPCAAVALFPELSLARPSSRSQCRRCPVPGEVGPTPSWRRSPSHDLGSVHSGLQFLRQTPGASMTLLTQRRVILFLHADS